MSFITPSCTYTIMCALLLCSIMAVTRGGGEDCVFPVDTVPYVTFMGVRLPNHSFVDLEQLGNAQNGSNVLQCHTDSPTCCAAGPDGSRGQWVLPNGQVVRNSGAEYSIRSFNKQIDLAFNGDIDREPTIGIFRCDVPTRSASRKSVYVGIYVHDDMYVRDMFLTVNSDLNGYTPKFTITCLSMSGPVGCVEWRRRKELIVNPNATSTLIDPVEGVYLHNLTVTQRLGGDYSCTVVNNRPASVYEGTYVQLAEEPLHLSAFQDSPTSIHVYWVKAQPIKKTIGYRIYYRGGSNGSVDIDDAQVNNIVLNGLRNNASYTVSIVGKSMHLPSERLEISPIHLAPGVPELRLYSATSDSISFSWSMSPGSVVDSYEVKWDRDHNQFASFRDLLSSKSNNYTVTGLKDYGNATFSISVTAHNAVGSATSPSMNVAANFAAVNSDDPTDPGTSSTSDDPTDPGTSSTSDDNIPLIVGVVVGCVVILAMFVFIALLVYCYMSKSKKSKDTPVDYSVPVPAAGYISPPANVPPVLPPPRPEIRTFNNRSYVPSSNANHAVRDDDQQTVTSYYSPMSYTYPNAGPPHPPPRPRRPTNVDNTTTTTTANTTAGAADGEMNTPGHGYDYITVQK